MCLTELMVSVHDMSTRPCKWILYTFKNCDLRLHHCKTERLKSSILDSFKCFYGDWREIQNDWGIELSSECILTFTPAFIWWELAQKSRLKSKMQAVPLQFRLERESPLPPVSKATANSKESHEPGGNEERDTVKGKGSGSNFSISSPHLLSNQRGKVELCFYKCVCDRKRGHHD